MSETNQYSVPLRQSYWVISHKLLAGCYPGAEQKEQVLRKLEALVRQGIRHIVNLMESAERDWYGNAVVPYEPFLDEVAARTGHSVTVSRMPIRDTSAPSREHMRAILDDIDRNICQQKPVYVHCLGGLGRTGTVVGCYLARHGIALGQKALDMIDDLRKDTSNRNYASPQFPEQCEMVMSWKEGE